MIDLNYHHLYYFHAVAKAGSIAKAKDTLLLAQPTISAQIKELEAQLGRRLFERQGRGLRLTEDGRMVMDYAESIFELGRELKDVLRDHSRPAGLSVQLGVATGTPRAFAHAFVEQALAAAPGTHVLLREGTLEHLCAELDEHRLDLVLADQTFTGASRERLTAKLVGRIPVVLAAPRSWAGRRRRLEELAERPWILPANPGAVYQQVMDLLSSRRLTPEVVAEVSDVEVARRLVIAGRGIAPLNAYTVSVSLPAGAMKVVAGPEVLRIQEPIYLLGRKRRRTNPVAERLFERFSLRAAVR